jgi:hypothetical protein
VGGKWAWRRSAAHSKNRVESLNESPEAAPTQCAKQTNTTENTNTSEINMAKIGKTRKEKPQIKIESNQSQSDESEAKGGMDMDGLIGVKYCLLDPPLYLCLLGS